MPELANPIDTLTESEFQTSLEQAKIEADRTAADAELREQVQTALHEEIAKIRSFSEENPDSDLAKANQHLLGTKPAVQHLLTAQAPAAAETWIGGGSVNLTSFVWWALGVTVMFKPPLGFMMGAKGGPDWAASTFTSGVAGSFVVDPQKIRDSMRAEDAGALGTVYKGSCNFQLGQLGAGAGAVRISFYGLDGTYWGLMGGVSAGLGGASISGQGDLVWS